MLEPDPSPYSEATRIFDNEMFTSAKNKNRKFLVLFARFVFKLFERVWYPPHMVWYRYQVAQGLVRCLVEQSQRNR